MADKYDPVQKGMYRDLLKIIKGEEAVEHFTDLATKKATEGDRLKELYKVYKEGVGDLKTPGKGTRGVLQGASQTKDWVKGISDEAGDLVPSSPRKVVPTEVIDDIGKSGKEVVKRGAGEAIETTAKQVGKSALKSGARLGLKGLAKGIGALGAALGLDEPIYTAISQATGLEDDSTHPENIQEKELREKVKKERARKMQELLDMRKKYAGQYTPTSKEEVFEEKKDQLEKKKEIDNIGAALTGSPSTPESKIPEQNALREQAILSDEEAIEKAGISFTEMMEMGGPAKAAEEARKQLDQQKQPLKLDADEEIYEESAVEQEAPEQKEEPQSPEEIKQARLRRASIMDAVGSVVKGLMDYGAYRAAANPNAILKPIITSDRIPTNFTDKEILRQKAEQKALAQSQESEINREYKQALIDQMSPEAREKEFQRKKELAKVKLESKMKAAEKRLTEGQKAEERAYGKDVGKFEKAGGDKQLKADLTNLEEIIEDYKSIGELGPLDQFIEFTADGKIRKITNKKLEDVHNRMSKIVKQNLRKTLGAQFTEKEAADFVRDSFNPLVGVEANVNRLEKEIERLKNAGAIEIARYKHYKKNKSLSDFDATKVDPSNVFGGTKKSAYSRSQERGILRVMERNNISRDQAIKALKGAGKL